MKKGMVAFTLLTILLGTLSACQREAEERYISVKGKIFIFNVRLARAFYEVTLNRHEAVPDGSMVVAQFEDPAGGPPFVSSQRVFPKMTRIDLQSPDATCIVEDRPYRIVIELKDPEGAVLQKIETTLVSTADQTLLPATSLVTGPAYDRNEAAFGKDGRIVMTDNAKCPKWKGRNVSIPALQSFDINGSADDFGAGKPIGDFFGGRFRGVRAMNGIFADRQSVKLANGAFGSVGGIGGAHDFAVLQNGVFTFQDLNDGRAGRHEVHQFAEEGTILVNGIEAFGFAAAHPDAARSDDPKAGTSSSILMMAPVRLRLVASGLIIEKVRSIAMFTCPCELNSGLGGQSPPSAVLTRGPIPFHAASQVRGTPACKSMQRANQSETGSSAASIWVSDMTCAQANAPKTI